MDESDMQVPDEDDRHEDPSRSKTIKANTTRSLKSERRSIPVSSAGSAGRMKFDQSGRQQDYETTSGIRH